MILSAGGFRSLTGDESWRSATIRRQDWRSPEPATTERYHQQHWGCRQPAHRFTVGPDPRRGGEPFCSRCDSGSGCRLGVIIIDVEELGEYRSRCQRWLDALMKEVDATLDDCCNLVPRPTNDDQSRVHHWGDNPEARRDR